MFHSAAVRLLPQEVNLMNSRRVVLVGDAHSGKSTWLKSLAVCCGKHSYLENASDVTFPLVVDQAPLLLAVMKRSTDPMEVLRIYCREAMKNALPFKVWMAVEKAIHAQRYWLVVDCLDKIPRRHLDHVLEWTMGLLAFHPLARASIGCVSLRCANELRQGVAKRLPDCCEETEVKIWTLNGPVSQEAMWKIVSARYFDGRDVPFAEELEQEMAVGDANFFRSSPFTVKLLGDVHIQTMESESTKSAGIPSMVQVRYVQRCVRELTKLQFATSCAVSLYEVMEKVAFHLQSAQKRSTSLEPLESVLTGEEFSVIVTLQEDLYCRNRTPYLMCLADECSSASSDDGTDSTEICFSHIGLQHFFSAQYMAKQVIRLVRRANKKAYKSNVFISKLHSLVEELIFGEL